MKKNGLETQMQDILASAETYAAPWRERDKNGALGEEYGPASPTAHARQVARFNNWAYQPLPTLGKPVLAAEAAERVHTFMRPDGVAIREDVPRRERDVYELVICQGHSVRWCARHMKQSRQSVKSYIKRLVGRALV